MDLGDRRDRIDHTGATYVWEQAAEDLAELITSGEVEPGSKLPPELALADVYGVSRVTVRRVVAELAERGLLVIRHGRGTYVAARSAWKTGEGDAEA